MQQDPVYTQTHSRTHRLGGDGGLACNRIHPPPPPLQPHPYTHTHTFMLTRGKRKSLRLISGASAPTSQRPNKVTVGVTERGQGPRDTGSTRGNREVGVWEEEGGGRAAVADNGGKTEDREEGSACSQEMMAVG